MGFGATEILYKNVSKCEYKWGKEATVLSHFPKCPRRQEKKNYPIASNNCHTYVLRNNYIFNEHLFIVLNTVVPP